ncbi:MAG: hypothetical protein ACRDO9_10495, partial [Gaiellales bacterium]
MSWSSAQSFALGEKFLKVEGCLEERVCVASIALLVALGGTRIAAVGVPLFSVGTPQLKSNAVISNKVKN